MSFEVLSIGLFLLVKEESEMRPNQMKREKGWRTRELLINVFECVCIIHSLDWYKWKWKIKGSKNEIKYLKK